MNQDFWRGKRVFITGHTGFKGSWLSLWLHSLGANVTGYALEPPTNPSLFKVAGVADVMTSITGDIRDLEFFRKSMQAAQPEIVFHMAAQPLVRYSYVNPVETYETNVMGTVYLFESVRLTPSVKSVLNITTDKCYENKEWVWGYRENDPMGGYDPYSSSKGCSELVTSTYHRSFLASAGVGVASARAGNVIGGGDWAKDRLIPDILRAFEKSQSVEIRNPQATRPWQHVLEPLSGYLAIAERLWHEPNQYAEGWNLGPSDEDAKSVGWILERMISKWGSGATSVIDAREQPHEANYLKLDISKARQRLSWNPKWDLDTALNKTIDWHQAWLANADMRLVCLEQIQHYSST